MKQMILRQPRLARVSLAVLFAMSAGLRAQAAPATALFNDQTIAVEKTFSKATDPKDLWVSPEDLKRINGFELKPQGACLGDLCIPIKQDKEMLVKEGKETWFNVTGLARKMKQAFAVDEEKRVWSFAPIPANPNAPLDAVMAPDFALSDMNGKVRRLSDYRGKKVLILTWASWCLCSRDLPNWEKVYNELKGKGFEIVAAAQDTGGNDAAKKYYDSAKASFTALIDPYHTVSTLYNMVNVPTGVWVDEKGRIVRPSEVAYTFDAKLPVGNIAVEGVEYTNALRDWVEKGEKSIYVMKPGEVSEKLKRAQPDLALADAEFKLGVYFRLNGDVPRGDKHMEAAQRLNPDSWNYHRQEWAFGPNANKNWIAKVQALNGKGYYAPLELPKPQ